MNYLRTSIKFNKKLVIFILSFILVGIILGIIYYLLQSKGIKIVITNELINIKSVINNSKNNILFHFLVLTLIFLVGFIVVGIPLILFYLFYEAMSLGFLIAIFTANHGVKGMIFSLFFILINKLVYLVILNYMALNSIKTTKKIVKSFVLKSDETINNLIRINIPRYLIIITVSLANDILIYFIGSKILNVLTFLI